MPQVQTVTNTMLTVMLLGYTASNSRSKRSSQEVRQEGLFQGFPLQTGLVYLPSVPTELAVPGFWGCLPQSSPGFPRSLQELVSRLQGRQNTLQGDTRNFMCLCVFVKEEQTFKRNYDFHHPNPTPAQIKGWKSSLWMISLALSKCPSQYPWPTWYYAS